MLGIDNPRQVFAWPQNYLYPSMLAILVTESVLR
jgi:hypothetical protein